MIRYYPESTLVQLEFEKIRQLLMAYCQSELARSRAEQLRVHTRPEYIRLELKQTDEYVQLLRSGQVFPNDHLLNLSKELKMLEIPGAILSGEDFMSIRRLAESIQRIFRWFDKERRVAWPALEEVIRGTEYDKTVIGLIDDVLDEHGQVRDEASDELSRIRMSLYKKRQELRRLFDRIVQKLVKAGVVSDIEESFLNGRRVVAVLAEYKRQVKGILHGESDTRKTTYIEPEETIELNNDVFTLEHQESKEVYRVLKELTSRLSAYAPLLHAWHQVTGDFDFIRAKARFALELNASLPRLQDKSYIHLINAYHPLLYLYNKKADKQTHPVNIKLDDKNRILLISGPNAGGKTVTLKTVGLLQLMIQSGLLVPVHPDSEFGIFKQVMIHIGDTQSLEFDLSTYSAHLLNMKYFMEHANGRTLFFIDELGSGSDPNMGGAFAEVILQELIKKHAFGIVTTHYLNLKIMANKTPGIFNGAMAFDEQHLLPLYRLITGKPGSSYTFSIAERIGLKPELIAKARALVDEGHFRLDKLLNQTEQDLRHIDQEKQTLDKLIAENERLKKNMENLLNKEKHHQQIELLKHQNKITEEKTAYLRDMERKLKQLVTDWRKADGEEKKNNLVREMQVLLFGQPKKTATEKSRKKLSSKYRELKTEIAVGQKVLMKNNHQVGTVNEIRGKNAVIQLGLIPITVALQNLVAVEELT